MKKKLFYVALAVAALISGNAYAQSQSDSNRSKDNTELRKKDKKSPRDKKAPRQSADRAAKRFNPFEGIQLSDEQQQRLNTLQQNFRPEKNQGDKKEAPKEKLSDEQKKQMKDEMQAKRNEAKKNYLNGVKEILSPDQYVVFLENFYLYSPQQENAGAPGMRPGMKRGR